MLIKVCGLKDRDNVEELLSRQAPDLLGMIFYDKSQRYIGSKPLIIAQTELGNIPKVGVFVNASIRQIVEMQQAFGLEWVQLHGEEDVAFITALKEALNISVIKVFRVTDRIVLEELRSYEPIVDYFLFDTQTSKYGGSGKQFDWGILEGYDLSTPFILSGGIDLEDTDEILNIYRKNPKMAGVDINSKFETAPGLKDPDKVASFIKIIRDNTINRINHDRNR